eukprot:CAMPEP_0198336496 /NCGR_PEP_ID=MMETSP1450-20131203/21026_1 /TAXON_ID=753684 ORGANISM="Madagascaria erythrocladiodes, Strain CCMP3234" /NCGR_SAMPLE_ID=MMETSP1450 /ASSEMBLY_ACC=CAM_ASM_001115 /LENGTH=99 /DNA_ID=CAMNT_0044041239 /DNA_START=605 /DNA_END=904 /DNA_ORIENTATION=-
MNKWAAYLRAHGVPGFQQVSWSSLLLSKQPPPPGVFRPVSPTLHSDAQHSYGQGPLQLIVAPAVEDPQWNLAADGCSREAQHEGGTLVAIFEQTLECWD